MWATKVISVLVTILYIPVAIVGAVTTFIGGFILIIPLVGLLFMLVTALLWLPFVGLLLITAWAWHRTPGISHPVIALIGIPLALVGNTYIALVPAGPDPEAQFGRHSKQIVCQQWPYAFADENGRLLVDLIREEEGGGFFSAVNKLVYYMSVRDSPWRPFIT